MTIPESLQPTVQAITPAVSTDERSTPADPQVAIAPKPLRQSGPADPDSFPGEVEMTLVEHLEELRRRILRSLLALVLAAAACLALVRPLVRLLELPAGEIRFLQLAPGEFLFVSLKVAGYGGLTLALPYMLYEALARSGGWWPRRWPLLRCCSPGGWCSPGGPWCQLP